ncbi:ras-related and estrogen-regulated growth inhibitor [Lingula anatina]|uniref:small monomeric GTPase n=1 Tax=Lingula anatina TaxID=7574 RepID=A0A1S3JG73_LINAN|nr:ras-related and estrogen-regulated growth inhibitor [Lingula anatina]|eukprot:XP_013409141.1 ras-related and estrogen-regulated growth inhibitor [Lingula anatina]
MPVHLAPPLPAYMMTTKNGKTAEAKLVVVGAPGVGKSALIVRFLTKRFIWDYDPTLECTYKHQTTIDDENVALEILDTAGLDDPINKEGHIRWGDGFIVVYSVTDRSSFDEVSSLKQYFDEVKKARNVSCVIIGNKIDLERQRQVTTEEGERLASELACAFFETSACEGGEDILEAFHEVYREVKRRKSIENRRRRSSAQQVRQVFNKMLNRFMDS